MLRLEDLAFPANADPFDQDMMRKTEKIGTSPCNQLFLPGRQAVGATRGAVENFQCLQQTLWVLGIWACQRTFMNHSRDRARTPTSIAAHSTCRLPIRLRHNPERKQDLFELFSRFVGDGIG